MPVSKKHHYIPRFYLTGFTDAKNQFFVYDKQTGNIWLTSPENSFAENHRNTGTIINPQTKEVGREDLPEEMLSRFDDRSAATIYDIRRSTLDDDILTPERLYYLRFFIVSTFWRTPANDNLRNKLIYNSSFEDLGFGLFKGKKRLTDIEAMLMEIDLWIKMYPTLLSLVSFRKEVDTSKYSDFKLYYRSGDKHIVTDAPLLLKSYQDFNSLNKDFLFPVSNKIFLVATTTDKPQHLPPEFNMKMDLLLFKRAHRYVACHNRDYLVQLSDLHKKLEEFSEFDLQLTADLFRFFA